VLELIPGNDAYHLHPYRRRRHHGLLQAFPPSRGTHPLTDNTYIQACFLNIEDSDETKDRLRAWGDPEDIDYIVVTDGEEILGIGDQGAQGVGISQAKLSPPITSPLADCSVLMTLCAGINPNRTLPIILDVGTEVLLPLLS
jgi:malic enzyme